MSLSTLPKTIILSQEKNASFLDSKPFDPVTGDCIEIGDEVTVCRVCHAVLLMDSYEYLGGKHCNQHEFTNELPTISHFVIKKAGLKGLKGVDAKIEDIFNAWIIDMVLFPTLLIFTVISSGLLASMVKVVLSDAISGWDTFALLFYTQLAILGIYYLTKDAWFGGRSLGKKMLRLKVLKENGEKCDFLHAIFRGLLSPLHIFTPIFWYFEKTSLVDKISKTRIVKLGKFRF